MTIQNRNTDIIELLKSVNEYNIEQGIPIDMNEELLHHEEHVLILANLVLDHSTNLLLQEKTRSFATIYNHQPSYGGRTHESY